jgi:hypothetical protein
VVQVVVAAEGLNPAEGAVEIDPDLGGEATRQVGGKGAQAGFQALDVAEDDAGPMAISACTLPGEGRMMAPDWVFASTQDCSGGMGRLSCTIFRVEAFQTADWSRSALNSSQLSRDRLGAPSAAATCSGFRSS